MQRTFYICLEVPKNHSRFAWYCFTRGVRFIPCNTHIQSQPNRGRAIIPKASPCAVLDAQQLSLVFYDQFILQTENIGFAAIGGVDAV